jgi:hypothetical protein
LRKWPAESVTRAGASRPARFVSITLDHAHIIASGAGRKAPTPRLAARSIYRAAPTRPALCEPALVREFGKQRAQRPARPLQSTHYGADWYPGSRRSPGNRERRHRRSG